jgi:hypothetical protein
MPLVGDGLEGEYRPIPHLDVIVHVGEKERGVVIRGGGMWATLVGRAFLLHGPWCMLTKARDPRASKPMQVLRCRMRDVTDGWVNGSWKLTRFDEGIPFQPRQCPSFRLCPLT